MSRQTILIVEDDPHLSVAMRVVLARAGYDVLVAGTKTSAEEQLATRTVDLIVLDIVLPDGSGLSVLEAIRASGRTDPVLVVSGVADDMNRAAAEALGADGFLAKPFTGRDLIEHCESLRRDSPAAMMSDRITIDVAHYQVSYNGRPIALTPKEFDLLHLLLNAQGRVLTREEILLDIWHLPASARTRTLDYHIRSLNRKMLQAGVPGQVQLVRGRGAMWRMQSSSKDLA